MRLAYYTGWTRKAIRAMSGSERRAYMAELPALQAELLGEAITASFYPHLGGSDEGTKMRNQIQRDMRQATDFRTLEEQGVAGRKALRRMVGKTDGE